MNDSELLRQFQKGDREAFSQLAQRYARPLTLMILRLVRSQEEEQWRHSVTYAPVIEELRQMYGPVPDEISDDDLNRDLPWISADSRTWAVDEDMMRRLEAEDESGFRLF